MLDIGMFEELARPVSGLLSVGSRRPPDLAEVFARVVATGWAPRRLAFERELAHLEVSTARGDSIAPLLQDGDTIFIDPHTPAQSGDLVSFALSARGSEVQNSNLPAGQSPWCKGARWVKLHVDYRGHAMLLDRYSSAATATLMGGESPDDHVPLFPVRNVARAGRLLFTPDSYSAQIGIDAVSQILSVVVAGAVQLSLPPSGVVQNVDVITGTITATGRPVAVDVSTFFSIGNTNLNSPTMCRLTVRRDGSDIGTAIFDGYVAWLNANASAARSWNGQVTLTVTDAPAAGSHTYAMHVTGSASGSAGTSFATSTNTTLKIREIKR